MAETKCGTFDELVESAAEEVRAIMLELRSIALDLDPDAVEVVRLGDRAAALGRQSRSDRLLAGLLRPRPDGRAVDGGRS